MRAGRVRQVTGKRSDTLPRVASGSESCRARQRKTQWIFELAAGLTALEEQGQRNFEGVDPNAELRKTVEKSVREASPSVLVIDYRELEAVLDVQFRGIQKEVRSRTESFARARSLTVR